MVALTKKFTNFEKLQTIKFEITGDAYYLIKSTADEDDDEEIEEDGDDDEEEDEEVEEEDEEVEEGAEVEGGEYHGDWLKAIELSCKKNARRLVNY